LHKTFTSALVALGLGATGLAQAQAQAQDQAKQQVFKVRVENIADEPLNTSKGPVPFTLSPGVWAVHTGVNPMFKPFERLQDMRGKGLANLAEDGKPLEPLVEALKGQSGVNAVGILNTPESKMEKGGLKPGTMYEFTVSAAPGSQLTLATMFAGSNDLFYAPYGLGIPLFADGKPISGDVTSMLALWDAGTEENQEPGVGAAQPHRSQVGVGPDESKPVRPISYVNDSYKYPMTSKVIRVTITPVAG
jgi:hypothetical protein